MFESGLRTTPYANRVAQERLFLCLKSPISVQYIGLPEKQFSILHFVVDGPSLLWLEAASSTLRGQGGFAMLLERFDHVAQVANIKRRHFVSTPTLVNIQ